MLKKLTATLCAVVILSAFTCSKNVLLSNASDVLASLRASQPLVNQLLPGKAALFIQTLDIASKLKDAIAKNDAVGAAGYLANLIPFFDDIVENDIPQIKDEATRTRILTALALCDIGLSYLANHVGNQASTSNQPSKAPRAMSRRDVVAEFAAKEVWGRKYAH